VLLQPILSVQNPIFSHQKKGQGAGGVAGEGGDAYDAGFFYHWPPQTAQFETQTPARDCGRGASEGWGPADGGFAATGEGPQPPSSPLPMRCESDL